MLLLQLRQLAMLRAKLNSPIVRLPCDSIPEISDFSPLAFLHGLKVGKAFFDTACLEE